MADKGIIVNFEEAKAGLQIPKSPQYRALQRIQRVLAEEKCVMVINAGLEQIGPNIYRLFASPQIKEMDQESDET
jgi:hypothetical protein